MCDFWSGDREELVPVILLVLVFLFIYLVAMFLLITLI
jgi:hypothetical protein